MTELGRFDSEALNELEKRLWNLVKHHSPFHAPPTVEALLAFDNECDLHANALGAYAEALVQRKAKGWHNHPLLEHLEQCLVCREHLEDMLTAYQPTPATRRRADTDIDITVFASQLPDVPDKTIRGTLDPRRPLLVATGYFDEPASWYYSLEQAILPDDPKPGLLLTIVTPENDFAGVEVRAVVLGRILHGTADDEGQVFFPNVTIASAEEPLIPTISIRLLLSKHQN